MTALASDPSAQQVSKSSLDAKIVASGVDALYLSGSGEVPRALFDELAYQRDLAEAKLPASVHVGPILFAVSPSGFGKYRYGLDHPLGKIGVSPSDHLPPIRVQPRSELIHGVGSQGAVAVFSDLLSPIVRDLRLSVSRLDLYADVTGFPLEHSHLERFVCRADARRCYETAGRCSGFDFGTRGARRMHGRIYDKLLDVERTGHDWWFEIWGENLSEHAGVTRVELEFPRQVLTDFDLDTPDQVLTAISALWRYGTSDWLSYRIPSVDSNRSRWALDPVWELVQHAPLTGTAVDLQRITARARAGSLRRLTPGLIGYLVGFAAQVHTAGITDTLAALDGHIRNDEIVRGLSFAERVERRRLEGRAR
jgi:hypothetical protein